jgi:hypothetical protein
MSSQIQYKLLMLHFVMLLSTSNFISSFLSVDALQC